MPFAHHLVELYCRTTKLLLDIEREKDYTAAQVRNWLEVYEGMVGVGVEERRAVSQ
jgi:hypothetical protein